MTNINSDRRQSCIGSGSGRVAPGARRVSDPRRWKRSVAAVAVASCFAAGVALANPTGPVVVSGQASFNQQGSALSVTNSANAIIHWQGFSIGPAEITRFIQPSASSAVLNRVVGGVPSDILGALQSNGRVFLINPSGIVFGAGAQIDVAGLVASTLNITNEDFLSGRLRFAETPGAGSVVNQGAIRTAPRGNVYLVAPNVETSGVITSPQGEIILAAGQSVELVDVGTPDLRVQITAPANEAVNLGSVVAQSGRIGIYAGLIQQKGVVNADTVVVGENGRIRFQAKDITLAPGSVTTASGAPGGVHDGGDVRIVADGTLDLQRGAEVHADGGVDGGNGGFLELSGRERIALNGVYTVRRQAEGYHGGELLIDPQNIRIVTGGGDLPPGTSAEALLSIDPNNINQAGAISVTLDATNDITVDSTITAANLRGGSGGSGSGSGAFLQLTAGRNVDINSSILLDGIQELSVLAGNSISVGATLSAPTVQAGRIGFGARAAGITVAPGATVLASNAGSFASVGMLAGTVTGSDFASTGANAVNILGTVRATAPAGFGASVDIAGAKVTIGDTGIVAAETVGSATASATTVRIAAMDRTIGGFGEAIFPSQVDYNESNSVVISGRVAATDPNFADVFVSGGTVTVSRGTQTGPNIDATGSLGADISIAALTQASNFSGGGFPLNMSSGLDRALIVTGGLRSTGGATGFADVELQGGTATLGAGATLEALSAQSADVSVAAASSSSEVPGSGGTVNNATFVAGNRVQVDSGATLNALASGFGDVTLIGGSVSVAGDLQSFGNVTGTMALVAASQFNSTLPTVGPEVVDMVHGAGHSITITGNLVVGAGLGSGSAQLIMAGDSMALTGGTQAAPTISVSSSGPFGGILAVAASTSTVTGSSLTASTHNTTTNLMDVSGWMAGSAQGSFTLDVVGGRVNVASGAGLQASGTTVGEITVAAVGGLNRISASPNTYHATQAAGNSVTIGGSLVAGGGGVISVIGGSVDIQTSGVVDAQGSASRVALAAGSTADFTGDPVFRLTGLSATAANTLSLSGHVNAQQQVDILGGAVTVAATGQAAVSGGAPVAVNVAAVTSYTDLAGSVNTTQDSGSLTQVSGTLAADSVSGDGRVSVLGGSVLVNGTVNADGGGIGFARVEILAAGTASFGPGFSLNGHTADTTNTVNVSGTLNAGLGGAFSSDVNVLGGQVTFSGLAQSSSDFAKIFIAAASGPCSGTLCPSVSGMQVNLSGTATAQGADNASVSVSAYSISQTGGTLNAGSDGGATVNLVTAGGDIAVGGLVSAQGGSFGEGNVSLQAGPSSGNIEVTSTGSLQASDAFGGLGSAFARVTAVAPAGTITVNGSVLASNTGTGSGGAFADLEGQFGVTVNGSVSAQATADFAGVGLIASGGSVLVGPGASVLASNGATTPFSFASASMITGSTGAINVQAGSSVAAVGQSNAAVSLDTLGGITVGGSVSATASGPTGVANVGLGGSGGAAFINVVLGGEVEATAPGGGLVFGTANGNITIGGNIYGGVAGGGVFLDALGAIVGAGGTIDANVGDSISLSAGNGIGAVGAPVLILDGQPLISAVNSGPGDVVITLLNGDLVYGPVSGGGFGSAANLGGGGIDLVSQTGNALVQAPLSGSNSFLRVAAAGGVTVSSSVDNSLGSVFLVGAGGVTIQGETSVSAQQDISIAGGPVSVNSSRLFAVRDLVISGNSITVQNSFLTAGRNTGLTSLGDLTVEDSLVFGGEITGSGLFTATVLGDFLIRGVTSSSIVANHPDIGSPTLPVTIFGALRIEGTETAPAVLESVSPASVYLFFPLLGSGGVFVNGVEQTSSGLSGIFADAVPAVAGTNLFISYGGNPVVPVIFGSEVEVLQELVAPVTGYVNEATELAVPSGEQGGRQVGPGDEDDQKKKRPQNCS